MKKPLTILMSLLMITALTACSTGTTNTSIGDSATGDELASLVQVIETRSTTGSTGTTSDTTTSEVQVTTGENNDTHEDADDYQWDNAAVIAIELKGSSISAEGTGITISGTQLTISAAGTYILSGTLSDGQIVVNSSEDGLVRLILNGVEIHSSGSAPIYIQDADKAMIVLAENTQNSISDGKGISTDDSVEDAPNAAIFSMADLTFFGEGSLELTGNSNDGIASKDGLVIASGTISVTAEDDGIRGKDYLVIKDGILTIEAGGDGLKSDNDADETLGFIEIQNGSLNISSSGDAITAQTDVVIGGGEISLTSGGGSNARISADLSAKGIKGSVSVIIDGGIFNINSADDAIHSNGAVIVNDGTFEITSGDDGIHADTSLTINDGDLEIAESYEGLESALITLNAGEIQITASDDGINTAGGADGSGANAPMGGSMPGRGPGQDAFANSGNYFLYINGGTILVNADGDGIDSNGSIEMTNGVVIVNGPTENMNGPLDYMGTFNISGGFFLAVGSAGMAQAPSTGSTQNAFLINFNGTISAGTLLHVQNSQGENLLTFTHAKQIQSIVFSSPDLALGETYTVFSGGSSSGTLTAGLYLDGTYTPGTEIGSFTQSNVITALGSNSGRTRP